MLDNKDRRAIGWNIELEVDHYRSKEQLTPIIQWMIEQEIPYHFEFEPSVGSESKSTLSVWMSWGHNLVEFAKMVELADLQA